MALTHDLTTSHASYYVLHHTFKYARFNFTSQTQQILVVEL